MNKEVEFVSISVQRKELKILLSGPVRVVYEII